MGEERVAGGRDVEVAEGEEEVEGGGGGLVEGFGVEGDEVESCEVGGGIVSRIELVCLFIVCLMDEVFNSYRACQRAGCR